MYPVPQVFICHEKIVEVATSQHKPELSFTAISHSPPHLKTVVWRIFWREKLLIFFLQKPQRKGKHGSATDRGFAGYEHKQQAR